jgi:hypothetical protein
MNKIENENPIILDSEKLFALAINNYLNNNKANWIIHKSEFKYCYLDFVLINLNNLYSIYIEYKERSYAFGYKSYDTYFISLRKYEAIKQYYNNCYIVFDFTNNTKNDDEFYYIKYDEKIFNAFEKDETKSRLLIPSNLCKTTFQKLMTEMVDMISNRNLI